MFDRLRQDRRVGIYQTHGHVIALHVAGLGGAMVLETNLNNVLYGGGVWVCHSE